MVDRNIEEASARIGPQFFIFLSSIFLSFLQRNAQAGSRYHQRIGDKVAKTIVVPSRRVRKDRYEISQ